MPEELKRLSLSQSACPADTFAFWRKEGYLELSPPYQRGDVWGPIRQRNLIRSILIGAPIPALIVNDRFAANWGKEIAVIDGKQRITTILRFMDGGLEVPAEWFGLNPGMVAFPALEPRHQRRFRHTPVPVCEGRLESLKAEQEVFELVNFGGVPQGQSDIPESP